ncbi:Atp-dependent rna helicase deah13 [Thalictrum thalictroides]|uniref:RNA helicase n=1 Tax=Thalictrum thalictroides TaxID=46969 RepID=A0A7J6VJA0_THATH|nr:Atp-dependent rna helicase deah13 [Thalictrum thalictroides]
MNVGDEQWNQCSTNGDDSNAIFLPGKKKRKTKDTKQDFLKKKIPLSKSQKRKLKKLEEEKAKEVLLSESFRTLEKYRIRDEEHSLLKSSGNIGQVETMREKRRRAEQFSKAGLVVPQDSQPSKKRTKEGALCQTESEADESCSELEGSPDNVSGLILEERDLDHTCCSSDVNQVETCIKVPNIECEPDSASSSKDFLSNYFKSKQDDRRNPSLIACNYERRESTEPKDMEYDHPKANFNNSSIHVEGAVQKPLSAPTVVFVSRPAEIEENRKGLPIVMMEQEIMEAINEHSIVIICGETGCGKTTQVPQFLYEAGFGSSKMNLRSGIIGVTQPRRVAVLATAKRVAFELCFCLGKEVGFQVRHDKRIGDNCSIKFMTDGILLRELQSDFLLKRYSVIILDEAHERSLNTDILIGMLSRTILERQKLYQDQQEKVRSGVNIRPENMISQLKLVIMSATLRVEDFVSQKNLFLEPPPVIEVPARQFPVSIHFSKRTEIGDYMGQAYKKVMSIHKRLPTGGILVFVTGQREVEQLCKKLRKISRQLTYIRSKREIENEVTVASEANSTDQEVNMKDISEAFEIHGPTHRQIDRFGVSEEDSDNPDAGDSYTSDDSGSESDFTSDGDSDDDVGGSLDHETPEKGGELVNVLGEAGSLSALKAAFEALAGKNPPKCDAEVLDLSDTPVTDGCSKSSPSISEKKGGPSVGGLHVLPLYAMLPASSQLRVFGKVKEGERLVVVATNVAETSLTIPGIKYVVDTGRQKVKKYNSTNGMETYEIQWISKASAAQRAGRAGRIGPGHCYRLYSSAVFSNIFSAFSSAEISKVPVDGVVLLLKSMGIDKVVNFPFPTPPEAAALLEAESCLKALEALDNAGKLTSLGRAMARFPMSPRHSRMLLTVIKIMMNMQGYARANLVFGYAVAAAAALSLSNPFIIQFEGNQGDKDGFDQNEKSDTLDRQTNVDKQEKLKQKKLKEVGKVARAKFRNPSSDALSIAYALQLFELAERPVEFCNENTLHLKTMEEMSKLRKQLLRLVFHQKPVGDSQQDFLWSHGTLEDVEQAWRVSVSKHPLLLYEEELLGQAICAGWADRVAKRTRAVSGLSNGHRKANAVCYQACMVKETVFLHRWSSVARTSPEFVVYNELLQTKRPYMHGVTSIKAEWLVKYAGSLCIFSKLEDPKPYYEPLTDQVMRWVIPTFGPHEWEFRPHSLPIKDDDLLQVKVFAYALLEGHVLPCLKSVQKLLRAPPASILRPEALGQLRVGNLINRLKGKSKKIDSRAMLKETWNVNPHELRSEILDWFQKKFRHQFEELWEQMHGEVVLNPEELFPEFVKKEKKKPKKLLVQVQ